MSNANEETTSPKRSPKKLPKSDEEETLDNPTEINPSMEKISPNLLGSYSKKDKTKGKPGPTPAPARSVRAGPTKPEPKSATKKAGK
jgi:hypothetical protein